jgi:hypothetical protein
MNSIQTPVLTLLRRLEAQNIWRMTYNVGGAVSGGQPSNFSTAAAMALTDEAATTSLDNSREWYEDSSLTAQDALKLLVNRIRENGPVKQRHLQFLYQRCQSPDDLEKALRLTRLNYLARGELQQHDSFSHRTSAVLLHEAMRLGAPELAQKVLLQSGEFGLPGANTRHFNQLLIYHSKQSSLRSMLETYEMMKRAGPRPDSETCFILVKGCVDGGRPDLAKLVIQEFEAVGVRVRPGTKLYIEQHSN